MIDVDDLIAKLVEGNSTVVDHIEEWGEGKQMGTILCFLLWLLIYYKRNTPEFDL